MNNLSLLLYLADVVGSLDLFLGFVAFIATAAGVIFLIICVVITCEDAWDIEDNGKMMKALGLKAILPLLLVGWVGGAVVPSEKTVYMIAGSQMGEQALATPEFNKLRGILNKYLDEQLKAEEKKDED